MRSSIVAANRPFGRLGARLPLWAAAVMAVWYPAFATPPPAPAPPALPASAERWEMGVTVEARDGACSGIVATLPVPMDWPEQKVSIVGQQSTPHVRSIKYRVLEGGVRQMVVTIPQLAAGETASAIVTFEVTKSTPAAPDDVASLVVPRSTSGSLRKYLGPSPYIESQNPRMAAAAREAVAGKSTAWEQVEGIYDWVRARVQYQFDAQIQGALKALEDGRGDCEELTSLFIAVCRAQRIPARAVWVPGHCYPEFYLEDHNGQGHWIACQAAGARAFGQVVESRPILQKGDNFRVPPARQPQRYVQQTLEAQRAAAPPVVAFVQRQVGAQGTPDAAAGRGRR